MAENWKSGSKASGKEPWPLMPMLEFLDEHIRGRRTYTNVAALAEVVQPNVLLPVYAQPSTSSSSNQCSTSYDGNSFDCVFEEKLSLLHPESPPPQAEEPPVAVNLRETPASQRGKKQRHGTEDVIGENLRLIAEASSRFSQSLQSKRSSAEASFAEFIVTQLSPLSQEIEDEAMVKIMQVLMGAKKKNRLLS